jgi:hypothetical protein
MEAVCHGRLAGPAPMERIGAQASMVIHCQDTGSRKHNHGCVWYVGTQQAGGSVGDMK